MLYSYACCEQSKIPSHPIQLHTTLVLEGFNSHMSRHLCRLALEGLNNHMSRRLCHEPSFRSRGSLVCSLAGCSTEALILSVCVHKGTTQLHLHS